MTIDRNSPTKFRPEYDVSIRRFTDLLALTSPRKEAMGAAISEIEPQETVREHVNKPSVEEIFLLLDGTAEMKLDGTVYPMAAGDMAFARVGQSHAFTNTSTSRIRLLSVWWKAVEAEAEPA